MWVDSLFPPAWRGLQSFLRTAAPRRPVAGAAQSPDIARGEKSGPSRDGGLAQRAAPLALQIGSATARATIGGDAVCYNRRTMDPVTHVHDDLAQHVYPVRCVAVSPAS